MWPEGREREQRRAALQPGMPRYYNTVLTPDGSINDPSMQVAAAGGITT